MPQVDGWKGHSVCTRDGETRDLSDALARWVGIVEQRGSEWLRVAQPLAQVKPTFVHGDFGESMCLSNYRLRSLITHICLDTMNILVDPETLTITAVLEVRSIFFSSVTSLTYLHTQFEFAQASLYEEEEYFQSLALLGLLELREKTPQGPTEPIALAAWTREKSFTDALLSQFVAQGVHRPWSNPAQFELVKEMYWHAQDLCSHYFQVPAYWEEGAHDKTVALHRERLAGDMVKFGVA